MTDKNPVESSVEVSPQPHAVRDGSVVLVVERINSWVTTSQNYQNLQTGMTMHPPGVLLVEFLVEGVKEGEPISPEHLEQILSTSFLTTIPACRQFVETVDNNYGYEKGDW